LSKWKKYKDDDEISVQDFGPDAYDDEEDEAEKETYGVDDGESVVEITELLTDFGLGHNQKPHNGEV
jgi:hypothetical protein